MSRRTWSKLALSGGMVIGLLALDAVPRLEGLPVLILALGLALVLTDQLRLWLRARERGGLATLPFLAAALVLLLCFCRGRNLSQGLLLLVSIGVVFDILLVALALIGAAGKHQGRGVLEFLALAGVGLVAGGLLSLLFLLRAGGLAGRTLAGP